MEVGRTLAVKYAMLDHTLFCGTVTLESVGE
jgi:hypothetical protein